MSEHNGAKSHYLQAALAESFRIIERDHGAEYVDRLVDAIFRTFNVQDAVLELPTCCRRQMMTMRGARSLKRCSHEHVAFATL